MCILVECKLLYAFIVYYVTDKKLRASSGYYWLITWTRLNNLQAGANPILLDFPPFCQNLGAGISFDWPIKNDFYAQR